MIRTGILFFFLLTSQLVCAEDSVVLKDKFHENVDSINILLSIYDTLSSYEDHEYSNDDTEDGIKDIAPRINSIERVQYEIMKRLTYMLSDKKILRHTISDLIKENNSLFITCSQDSRLCFLSLDEKTGGTFRSTLTLIHYRLADGSLHTELAENRQGYYSAYLVDPDRQLYFVIEEVIGCTSCRSFEGFIVTLDSTYNEEMLLSANGRYDLMSSFDVGSKTFSYEYYVEGEEEVLYRGEAEYPEGYRCRRSGTYMYYKGEFIETELHIVWEKSED